jgi:hypothetical protein
MITKQMQGWGVEVSKATALEEMYLIYQAVRNYLADAEPWGVRGWRTWWLRTAPSASRAYWRNVPGAVWVRTLHHLTRTLDKVA